MYPGSGTPHSTAKETVVFGMYLLGKIKRQSRYSGGWVVYV